MKVRSWLLSFVLVLGCYGVSMAYTSTPTSSEEFKTWADDNVTQSNDKQKQMTDFLANGDYKVFTSTFLRKGVELACTTKCKNTGRTLVKGLTGDACSKEEDYNWCIRNCNGGNGKIISSCIAEHEKQGRVKDLKSKAKGG
jgi:hypothetical protein